jgi:hypothetical protein
MANPTDRVVVGPHALDPEPSLSPVESTAACCGGAPPAGADACCVRDADVKADGGAGCGCGSSPVVDSRKVEPKKKGCC